MSPTPQSGTVIGQRYRLVDVLGQGGMAVVWRAEHTETGRQVALKLVRAELATDAAVRELFVREARIAARIGQSDHIVDVLDAGIDATLTLPFLAMELLEGEPLDALLARQGPLPEADALSLLEQLGDALDQAHSAGVIHRDLKPQNLFLATRRRGPPVLKVLDFGIAKVAETIQQSTTQVGTPAYSAPEQLGATWRQIAARNGQQVSDQISAATDVWALGLVAFEMLTGAPSGAFWGAPTLAELPAKIFLEPLPTASQRAEARGMRLSARFDAWLNQCLALDAAQRFASAGAAAAALKAALSGELGVAGSVAPGFHSGSVAPPRDGRWPSASSPPGPAAAAITGGFDTVAAWAQQRGMSLSAGGEPLTYNSWQHAFVATVVEVTREGRLRMGDADVLVGEVAVESELRRAIGEGHLLVAQLTCPRIRHQVAIRTKKVTGIGDGLSRGLKALDQLVTAKPKAMPLLADPWFESKFEVRAPNAYEAQAALPAHLRHELVQRGFGGIIETRPGGMMAALDPARFDPAAIDQLLGIVSRVLAYLA